MGIITVVSGRMLDHATGKLMEALGQRFQTEVIQRWTKPRAQNFFEAFCQEVLKESSVQNNGNADVLLDMILEDDVRSEVLFDSYRRVCMARSRDMGPRIIGLLTAQVIANGAKATNSEEQIFMAAEQLTDDELLAFVDFYKKHRGGSRNSDRVLSYFL